MSYHHYYDYRRLRHFATLGVAPILLSHFLHRRQKIYTSVFDAYSFRYRHFLLFKSIVTESGCRMPWRAPRRVSEAPRIARAHRYAESQWLLHGRVPRRLAAACQQHSNATYLSRHVAAAALLRHQQRRHAASDDDGLRASMLI